MFTLDIRRRIRVPAPTFRADPAYCARLAAANGTPTNPVGPRRIERVTRAEIAGLFAADLYPAA